VDVGNNTNMKNGYTTNPNKPADFSPGDYVITSDGGSLMALLSNGSVILKSSGLAQILISKFNDLVRVVARNWERFSDIGQQTVANVANRMYDFTGWDRKLEKSKVGIYELKDIVGDVAAGEVLLGEPNTSVELPIKDDRVRRYWLEDQQGMEIMIEVLQDNGKLTVTVQDNTALNKTVRQHDVGLWDARSETDTTFSQVTIVPGSITINHEDKSVILLDGDKVKLNHLGAVTEMDASGIRSDFGGHFVHIDGAGVHMG
jgi:hypothetical protein